MLLKFLKNILLVTIPAFLICLLVAELVVFRFIIPACDQPHYSFDRESGVLRFEPNTAGLFTDGRFAEVRGRWRANNYGWNSEIDYVPGIGKKQPLVAIIGDSYVEGLQVDVQERFPEVLRRLLGNDTQVYSFGVSGAPLSQYLQMTRSVNRVFHPRTLVILLAHNDFDESLAHLRSKPRFLQVVPKSASFEELPPTPFESSPFLKICRHSTVFRYLELNCRVSAMLREEVAKLATPVRQPVYNANIDVAAVNREQDLIRRSTAFLVGRMRAENPGKRIIFLMDAPRFDIYSHNLAKSNVRWLHEMMGQVCREQGVEFLDLTGPFAAHFEQHRQNLESPVNAHWNRLGHELAARALWEKLKEPGPQAEREPEQLSLSR